jgi:hypothetical protein
MNYTDRELLELAAKAAGYWNKEFNCYEGPLNWNPLRDNDDAFRLAVQLEIAINPYAGKTVVAHDETRRLHHEKWDCWDNDPNAATRHAIVKIASEIGRSII